MLLRNYDNLMVAKTAIGKNKVIQTGTEFADGQINVKNLSGAVGKIEAVDLTYKCCPFSYMSAVALDRHGDQGTSWFVIGQGTTKPTYDDYKLESKHTKSAFSIDTSSLNEGEFVYDTKNKTYSKTLSYVFRAKIDTTVSEIGIEHFCGGYSSDVYLVYREVLEQPVSLTTDQYLKVSITTTVSANPNKPADVSASALVVE